MRGDSMKILIAVDGSDYTKHMLEYVAAQQAWLGTRSEVSVLTVVPELPPHVRAYMNAADVRSYCDQEAAMVLDPVRQFVWPEGLQPKIAYKVGNPGTVIANTAAAEGFDLIVMGSHGHTKLTSLVLGSVTAEVLASCRVPVLILRPGARES
jgi:nucleotide-binding universal stress UspA family protein